jgi:hypothetical protein
MCHQQGHWRCTHILWQNILDTQLNVSYTADNKKQVLGAQKKASFFHNQKAVR